MHPVSIDFIKIAAYQIPTDGAESDGTLSWDSTMVIIVWLKADDKWGIGFTYGHAAIFQIIKSFLSFIKGTNVFEGFKLWKKMLDEGRNAGSRGVVAQAISAVDVALWDLKAKLLHLPLCQLWGMARDHIPVYGSGGFTSYSDQQLDSQFSGWKKKGMSKFKMKVGRHPDQDVNRVKFARKVIGDAAELFVDANGAYSLRQALHLAQEFEEFNVTWFEEPVSSNNLEGLHFLRHRIPPSMNVAAGEYGYEIFYFRHMLESQAVDILQADATRCLGYTGFFQACHLSHAFNLPLSSHTAPSLHLHACLTQSHICHMEFFYDHARIEEKYFEGFPILKNGSLYPILEREGHGLEVKEKDLEKYLVISS